MSFPQHLFGDHTGEIFDISLVNFYTRFSSMHIYFSDFDSLIVLLLMNVHVVRQPNLEPGLQD
jgi:hypothetical protein